MLPGEEFTFLIQVVCNETKQLPHSLIPTKHPLGEKRFTPFYCRMGESLLLTYPHDVRVGCQHFIEFLHEAGVPWNERIVVLLVPGHPRIVLEHLLRPVHNRIQVHETGHAALLGRHKVCKLGQRQMFGVGDKVLEVYKLLVLLVYLPEVNGKRVADIPVMREPQSSNSRFEIPSVVRYVILRLMLLFPGYLLSEILHLGGRPVLRDSHAYDLLVRMRECLARMVRGHLECKEQLLVTNGDACIQDNCIGFLYADMLVLDGVKPQFCQPCPDGCMAGRVAKQPFEHEVEHLKTLGSLTRTAFGIYAEKERRLYQES